MIGMCLHKLLDFLFCDRCIAEGLENHASRPIEMPCRVAGIIDKICPIQLLWRILPKEDPVDPRRIFWPRNHFEGTSLHYDEECGIR